MDRREFLVGNFGAALLASLPADLFAQRTNPRAPAAWDAGQMLEPFHTTELGR
jgi:hypothetical protein